MRHARDAVHEVRPVLELGPLVVGSLDRHRDVDGLLNRHAPALADAGRAALGAAAAVSAESREQAPGCLLHQAARPSRLVDLGGHGVLELFTDGVTGLRRCLARQLRRPADPLAIASNGVHALLGNVGSRSCEAHARRDALGTGQGAGLALRRSCLTGVLDRLTHRVSKCVPDSLSYITSHWSCSLPLIRVLTLRYPPPSFLETVQSRALWMPES
jgi:hypothetical protein